MTNAHKFLTITLIFFTGLLVFFFWRQNVYLASIGCNQDMSSSSSQTELKLDITGTPRNNSSSSTDITMDVYDSSL